ncbi:MAG: ABC transporter permease [Anaerolineaceae bacterium]|nr:ABC transporter permease [Anaerolineaceae bacterium]
MNKLWRIAIYEYLRHVLRKRFLFAILSLPLFVLVMVAVGAGSVLLSINTQPVGYVDQSGWLADPVSPEGDYSGLVPDTRVLAYPDEATARQALDQNQIQAYYVVHADYLQTGQVSMVAREVSADNTISDFNGFLRANLLSGQSPQIVRRLVNGSTYEVRSVDNSRQFGQDQWIYFVLPILVGVLFIVVINTSGNYLLQAVVEEKENRTMEIVITSVSPEQLMGGKVIGNLSVGLTQLALWMLFPALGFLLARTAIPAIRDLPVSDGYVWLTLLTILPAFILIASLMATVGATATEAREAQQVAGLFTLPVVVPFWFISQIMLNPNGPLAVSFSLFPLTAPLTLPLRAAYTNIVPWQVAVSLGLLYACAIGALLLAGRAFRLGMLRYGKRLSWKELFGRG